MHLTAEELVRYNYVDRSALRTRGFALCRNPYFRMVSVYQYNCQPGESFKHFVEEVYSTAHKYWLLGNRSSSENDLYCHYLPQRAFTHLITTRTTRCPSGIVSGSVCDISAEPLLRCVVKLESLKDLERSKWESIEATALPSFVRRCLQGMPHHNKRGSKSKKKKGDWYDERTMAMVAEMYAEDFQEFGYDIEQMPGRPDLRLSHPPQFYFEKHIAKNHDEISEASGQPLVERTPERDRGSMVRALGALSAPPHVSISKASTNVVGVSRGHSGQSQSSNITSSSENSGNGDTGPSSEDEGESGVVVEV